MAHSHADIYGQAVTARKEGSEVLIQLGNLVDGDSSFRISVSKSEAIRLASEIVSAAETLP